MKLITETFSDELVFSLNMYCENEWTKCDNGQSVILLQCCDEGSINFRRIVYIENNKIVKLYCSILNINGPDIKVRTITDKTNLDDLYKFIDETDLAYFKMTQSN